MPVIKKGAWLYNEIVEVANASNGSTGTECIHYKDVFFSEYNEKYQILKYLTKFEMKKKKNFNTTTILLRKFNARSEAKQICKR